MIKNFINLKIFNYLVISLFYGLIFAVSSSHAAPLPLASKPYHLYNSAPPYLIVSIDDSGSMAWDYLPDEIDGYDESKLRDCKYNYIFYCPDKLYLPRVYANGTTYPNGPLPAQGCYDLPYQDNGNKNDRTDSKCETEAIYYQNGVKVVISPTDTQNIINYRNWYAYYSTRLDTVKTVLGISLQQVTNDIHVGLWTVNNNKKTTLTAFTENQKNTLYNDLYNIDADGGTALRQTMANVGAFFENNLTDTSTCRAYHHMMLTDGYWNGSFGKTTNDDGTVGPLIVSSGDPSVTYQYQPTDPYQDEHSGTLADVAMYYWNRDLRPDLDNQLGASAKNPAFWQHMVNHMVSFGLDASTINDYPNPWPKLNGDSADTIYDIWHAAINSRGTYYSAYNAQHLSAAYLDILSNLLIQYASDSAVELDNHSVGDDAHVYQSTYMSGEWTGDVHAYPLDPDTGIPDQNAPLWTAGKNMPAHDDRIMLTLGKEDALGIPFQWDDLTLEQQNRLLNPANINASDYDAKGQALVAYLRGDASLENSLNYRDRQHYQNSSDSSNTADETSTDTSNSDENQDSRRRRSHRDGDRPDSDTSTTDTTTTTTTTLTASLGAIINSELELTGAPPFQYTEHDYATFKENNKNRDPILYVSSNDGILHGFDKLTGIERLAYLPDTLLNEMHAFSLPGYNFKYLNDGTPTVGDVYINNAWRTILVNSLGAGGKGIYALDVTDPTMFSEDNADDIVLFEFTDNDAPNLGYTYPRPTINKFNNDKWGIIVPNGYNSTNEWAVLYILFIEQGLDGSWELNTGDYVELITSTTLDSNGLSDAAPVDIDNNFTVDYIYAGDLQGKLWKFDVSDAKPANWHVATNRYGIKQPLFSSATTSDFSKTPTATRPQPITSRPEVYPHPHGGYLVYVGTGSYITEDDPNNKYLNSFYGIWDNNKLLNLSNADLLVQTIDFEDSDSFSRKARSTSNRPIYWRSNALSSGHMGWKLDLKYQNNYTGERVTSAAKINAGYVWFTTEIPQSRSTVDECTADNGSGWLMALNVIDGSLMGHPIDISNDSVLDDNDGIQVGANLAAINGISTESSSSNVKFIKVDDNYRALLSSSDGSIDNVLTSGLDSQYSRASWRHIYK